MSWKTVNDSLESSWTAFAAWAAIGNHKWWVWIGVAFVVGLVLSQCAF